MLMNQPEREIRCSRDGGTAEQRGRLAEIEPLGRRVVDDHPAEHERVQLADEHVEARHRQLHFFDTVVCMWLVEGHLVGTGRPEQAARRVDGVRLPGDLEPDRVARLRDDERARPRDVDAGVEPIPGVIRQLERVRHRGAAFG
jgi:hypothetical protein